MAAFDQVLAKLSTVSSPTHEDTAGLEPERMRKRTATVSADKKDSHDRVAAPPVKNSNKKSKTTEASTERGATIPMHGKATAARAEAKLHGTPSTSVAAVVLPSTAEKTAAVKASHLARFGRRRAGKSVRRCNHYLPALP